MSSWHTGQLKYALGLGSIMSFYGIVTFIVVMMPEGSVAKDQKIIVIVLVLLTLPFTLLVGFLASRRSKKKAAAKEAESQAGKQADETTQQAPATKAAPVGTYTQVSEGAEEAVQFLKSSNLGVGGKDAVHSLPWYVVAGAPKTGKSSLVLASNLNFQNLPSQRQSEMKFIRPTGSVDWRVTSDALFIDTAGRYQTEGVDGEEWASLLETIKKYRSNRPIDGFILVVDASSILKSDDRQNEELAKTLRTRLDDAMQRLKVRFPVYLVFTNADSIEGLRDSFSSSKNENTALVWGATIPIEKSENAQALFDGEYELLHNSLMKRRLVRLSAPFPPVRQLRIFNFPLHFGSARRKFGSFVNALFRPNPFSENPFLRGFYFTAAPAGKASPQGVQTIGTSFFTERFFRDVLLRDKDLVRTMVAQRQRPPILGWVLTSLGALVVLAFLTMAGISLASNKQMLAEATRAGESALVLRRADANKDVLAKSPDEVRDEVRVMDEMKTFMTRLDNYERNGAPLYMRFGLYSGNSIYRNNLLPLYFNIIERRFKAPTVRRLEAELQKFASGETTATSQPNAEEEQRLDRYYNLLKAYLMLSDGSQVIDGNTILYREKAEATHVSNTLKEFWVAESKVPNDMKAAAEQHLEFWAKQIDRHGDASSFPRIALNEKLVEESRRKLQTFPAVNRYYSNQVTRISKEIDDKIGPTTVEAILGRNGADASYLTGSHRVPSAFTRPGVDLMKTAFAEADERLSEDDWVMGEIGKRQLNVAQATDQTKLEDFYYRDYADHWRRFVTGIQLRPYKNRSDASEALQILSSANSPIKILVRDIERNTNLSAKLDSGSWWDTITNLFSRSKTDVVGNTQPEKEFRPLTTFVGKPDDGENAPIEKYQAQLGQVYSRFSTVTDDSLRRVIEQMGDEQDPLDINKREQAIVSMLSGFTETPSGQEVSKLLQQPILNLKTLLGAGIKQQLQKAWNEEILPAAAEIESGYPFQESQTEADLAKLTAFLNPNDGRLSKFYKDRLEKYFEESGGFLKPVETADVQFSDEFVTYLNNAFALRAALFGTNPTPKFDYEFNLRPTQDALVEVTIDGQKVSSVGTGSNRLSFPAAQSAETGVLVTVLSSGTSSPDGTTPPAGPASSNPFQGTWGLFRFVDASNPTKQAGGEYLLSFSAGGTSVGASIKSSGGDIFDKAIFRQVKAPKAFMK